MSRPDRENPKDRLEETARKLRKHRPRPSAALIARVERLAERQHEQRRAARPRLSRRRLVFALAATLGIAAIGAVVAGEMRQSSRPVASRTANHGSVKSSPKELRGVLSVPGPRPARHVPGSTATQTVQTYSATLRPNTQGSANGANSRSWDLQAVGAPPSSGAGELSDLRKSGASKLGSVGVITSGKRLAELRATLLLKVENRDQLSKRTAEAMKIARSLHGYVVTASMHAPSRGVSTSDLVLKVPATRSQEALSKISDLGKILSQSISLVDVKGVVTTELNVIQALKREIASLEQTLQNQSLTNEARSQLQIKLANDRAQLNSLRLQRKSDILRGRLATITLTLTTGDLPKPAAKPSRVHKALDRAWDGLSSEISWAALGLIVASPFILLGVALAVLVRFRRRREERRLLEK